MQITAPVIVVLAVVAVAVRAVLQRRGGAVGRGNRRAQGGGIPRPGGLRGDPMAPVVSSHSEALAPHEVEVQELRLRAQANRVAAAKHEHEADALETQRGAADDENGLQAQAHREAAAKHQRTADELDDRSR